MRKLILILTAASMFLSAATPASSEPRKYEVNQKTLATFSSYATGLTSQQKAQVRAAVEANPDAEKFICTGIRYYSQPMSVNIMVRKRAKAACEYAKQLNPELSTWYQNKPTKARSYAGKVLLTVKSPVIQTQGGSSQISEEGAKLAPVLEPYIRGSVGGGVETFFGTWPNEWSKLDGLSIYLCESDPDLTSSGWQRFCQPFNIAFDKNFIVPSSESGKYLVLATQRRNSQGRSDTYLVKSESIGIGAPTPISTPPETVNIGIGAPTPISAPSIVGGANAVSEVSFDTGTWPAGWEVNLASSLYVCYSNPLGNSELLGTPSCPLLTNARNGPYPLFNALAGRYLAARVVLTNGVAWENYDLFRSSPIQSYTPSPTRAPRIISSQQVGGSVTLDPGEWPGQVSVVEYYSVLLVCDQPLGQSMVAANHGITTPEGCMAAGAMPSSSTIADWSGRYLGAIIHLVTATRDYFDYTFGLSDPVEGPTATTPVPDESPEQDPVEVAPPVEPQFTYYVVRRQDSAYCTTTNQNAEFVSGKVDIPIESDLGTRRWVYSAEFVQVGSGGYSTIGSKVLWERSSLWSNDWRPRPESYYNYDWRAVVELTCRVQK